MLARGSAKEREPTGPYSILGDCSHLGRQTESEINPCNPDFCRLVFQLMPHIIAGSYAFSHREVPST